jgi:hypothetical protein
MKDIKRMKTDKVALIIIRQEMPTPDKEDIIINLEEKDSNQIIRKMGNKPENSMIAKTIATIKIVQTTIAPIEMTVNSKIIVRKLTTITYKINCKQFKKRSRRKSFMIIDLTIHYNLNASYLKRN